MPWEQIGTTSFDSLVTAQYNVICGVAENGVYMYDGDGSEWTPIWSVEPDVICGNDNGLYALDSSGTVYQFGGEPFEWVPLLDEATDLIASKDELFAVSSGALYRFDSGSGDWQWVVQGIAKQIVATNEHLFMITSEISQWVYKIDLASQSDEWTLALGTSTRWLVAAENAVYCITQDDSIERFDLHLGEWGWVGNAFEWVFGSGLDLFGVDSTGVYLFSGVAGEWSSYCDPAIGVVASTSFLVGLSDSSLPQIIERPNSSEVEVHAAPARTAPAGDIGHRQGFPERATALTTDPPGGWDWIFTFEKPQGFDGDVWLVPYTADISFPPILLPIHHFEDGVRRSVPMILTVSTLDSIAVWTTSNYLADVLVLGSIEGWSRFGEHLYEFTIGDQISADPNNPTMLYPEVYARCPTTDICTIYIWRRNLPSAAGGHASMRLLDETYISWWPEGQSPDSLTFKGFSFYAPAKNPWGYDDDVAAEGRPPDYTLGVSGLDQDAIAQWWTQFRGDPSNIWSLMNQNCAGTVVDALRAGGAFDRLSPPDFWYYTDEGLWTPEELLGLVALLAPECDSGNPLVRSRRATR